LPLIPESELAVNKKPPSLVLTELTSVSREVPPYRASQTLIGF